MTEKLVRLSDVEFYLRRTAQNMLDEAEKDAETLSDGERGQIGACVLALRELADNAHRLPAVEAEPVVHAYWYGSEFDGYADGAPVYDTWGCSHCHEEVDSEGFPPSHDRCPHCGAHMDAKEGAPCE